jgi:hypothetical protein
MSLKQPENAWELAWHGCVVAEKDYYDVAALPDGGYIATHPTALRAPGDNSNLFSKWRCREPGRPIHAPECLDR